MRKEKYVWNGMRRSLEAKRKAARQCKQLTSKTYSVLLQYEVVPEQSELLARVLAKHKLIPYADAMKALETIPARFRTRVSEARAYQFKKAALEADIALTVTKN